MTSETDLCAALCPWLEAKGYQLYYEVKVGSDVADIVAVLPIVRNYTVIEAKLGLCLRLLAQADRWRGSAHRVAMQIDSS